MIEEREMRDFSAKMALFILVLTASSYVFADTVLKDRFSDSELIQIIKDDGYSAVTKLQDGAIKIKIEGKTYILFNKEDGDIQAFYGISGAKVTYEDINEWNRTKRLSRAYLDSDKDPILEADLLANGGLTPKHVTEFFQVFVISVRAFRKFIMEHDEG